MAARAMVLEFGMGVDVHGDEGTKAACGAVSDAIQHSPSMVGSSDHGVSLPLHAKDPDGLEFEVFGR